MKMATLGAMGALLLATLACSIFIGGPAYPDEPLAAPTGTPQTVQEQVQQALLNASTTGTITLQLTESQLTSYLAAKVAAQQHPAITDPRVYLRAGQMQIYGKATSGIFTANVSLTAKASVGSDGQPQLEITQTDFGPIAAPKALNDALAAFVREAFTGWLGPVATGFRLDSISIDNGVMTVSGRVR